MISIILPVFNCHDYLEECINSIIQQDFKEFELIFMNPNIHLIASIAYAEDHKCRLDLSQSILVSERDYVSSLTKGIRDFWHYRGLPCFAHSQTLQTHHERYD